MPKIADLTLRDNTGKEYAFEVYPTGTEFNSVAGVYIFTKRDDNRNHDILYIGETESFKDRPLSWGHPKWEAATRMGFNHICVLHPPNRVSIQNRLIAKSIPSPNYEVLS